MDEEHNGGNTGSQQVTETQGKEDQKPEVEDTLREECSSLLAQKEEEIKQLQDRVLRLAAEMENTRKRLEREKSEGISFANESMIRDMLPVADNLERAIQHGETESDYQGVLSGIRMTLKGFLDALSKYGCVPFEAMGKAFDPKYHQAVMEQEADAPERTVVLEMQKGYTLHERLLRPAMVVVSKSSTTPSSQE